MAGNFSDSDLTTNQNVTLENKHLRNTVRSLQGLVSAFSLYRGENQKFDLLLQNLDMIVNTPMPHQEQQHSQQRGQVDGESQQQAHSDSRIEDESVESIGNHFGFIPVSHEHHHAVNDNENDNDSENPQPGTSSAIRNKRKLSFSFASLTEADNSVTVAKKQREVGESSEVDEAEIGTPPDHPIFKIELVMLQILKNLTNEQLVLCRRISTHFKEYSTQILLTRQTFSVEFKYDWALKNYALKKSKGSIGLSSSSSLTLPAFTKLVETCPKFPCIAFAFTNGSLCAPDLQSFLSSHGRNIKRLSLEIFCPHVNNHMMQEADEYEEVQNQNQMQNQVQNQNHHYNHNYSHLLSNSNDQPTIYLLRKLLTTQVPNLNSLELQKIPSTWKTSLDRLFPEPPGKAIYLKNLKSLLLHCVPDKIVSDLLKVSTNLENIQRCIKIEPILKANKLHLLKELMWAPLPDEIRLYEKHLLASSPDSPPSVYHIETCMLSMAFASKYPILWPALSKVIEHVLKSSAASLTSFLLASSIGFLPHLRIPLLPKIKFIQIGVQKLAHFVHTAYLTTKIFPQGFQFTECFPNLTGVRIALPRHSNNEVWEEYFDNGLKPVCSVKILVFESSNFLPITWLTNFARLFPNVESLYVHQPIGNFEEAGKGLWGFKRLKHLSCEINVASAQNSYPALESAFTGFPTDTVLNLQESPDTVDFDCVNELREGPSILDLKDLRSLHLTLVDESQEIRLNYPPIFTHVTGLFAFQMCPLLRPTMNCRIIRQENFKPLKNALSSLSPYVYCCPQLQT